jgi:hypothetical protein
MIFKRQTWLTYVCPYCSYYADDFIVGFQHETDARRFWDAIRFHLRKNEADKRFLIERIKRLTIHSQLESARDSTCQTCLTTPTPSHSNCGDASNYQIFGTNRRCITQEIIGY